MSFARLFLRGILMCFNFGLVGVVSVCCTGKLCVYFVFFDFDFVFMSCAFGWGLRVAFCVSVDFSFRVCGMLR